jgi:hypothetical protein
MYAGVKDSRGRVIKGSGRKLQHLALNQGIPKYRIEAMETSGKSGNV